MPASGSEPTARRPPDGRVVFLLVAVAFAVTMLGTTLPTPLYTLYRETFGFSVFVVTAVYAAYATGVIATLLTVGRLSDQVGRKPVLLAGLGCSALSALVFLLAQGTAPLFLGRVLSGLSAGVVTGAATATLVNLVPPERRERATLVATAVNMGGLGLGPLAAGAVSELFGAPLRTVFALDLGVVLVLAGLLALVPEPEPERRVGRPRLRPQRPGVPAAARAVFVPAAIGAFAGFAVQGLFTSLAPSVMGQLMGVSHRATVGLVVCGVFSASAVGQVAMPLVPARLAQRVGVAILGGGALLLGLGVTTASFALLVAGGLIAGTGQGLSFRAGMAAVTAAVPAGQRAEVASSYFLVAYVALSLPVVGVGVLATAANLQLAGEVFSVVVALLAALTFVLLARRARRPEITVCL